MQKSLSISMTCSLVLDKTFLLHMKNENIRQALDEGFIGCGIFLDMQIAFDTVDHKILLANVIIMVFVVFQMTGLVLSNRQQYVSINGFDSGLTKINCGVPQRSVLGPFFCYILLT